MRSTRLAALIATLTLLAALCGAAVPNDGYTRLDGEIASVDRAKRTVLFRQKSGEELTIRMPLSQMFHVYSPATRDDLADGQDVKVYGKVQPGLKSVEQVNSICIMPFANAGTNKKTRIDGILRVQDGKIALQFRDRTIPMTVRDNVKVELVQNVGFDFLEPGTHLFHSPLDLMTTGYKRQEWVPVNEVRVGEPREKVAAYYAKKKGDK